MSVHKVSPPKLPKPPAHLSPEMRRWWSAVVAEFVIEDHILPVLTVAGEAFDRCQQARRIVDAEGLQQVDRFGQARPHGMLAVERDSRLAFDRMVRGLGLEGAPVPVPARGRAS